MINWRKPIIYSLLYLTGSKIPVNLRYIKSLENKSPQELKSIQKDKLKNILIHSYDFVPYYKNILKESGVINKSRAINLNNFRNIPILTKDIIRNNFENLKSNDPNYKKRKPYLNTSGGSTGEPVKFIQDKYYSDWNIANKIYYKTFGGQDIGNRELRLWGSERDIMKGKEKFATRAKNWLYNRKEFNSFRMSESDMDLIVKNWNKYEPRWVEAYIQSIYELAKYVIKNNYKVHSPKGVLTSAGTLYPEMKETIEKAFRCKIFNRYGSREVGDIACSKNNNILNTSIWNQYIEILNNKLDKTDDGEIGKIFITNLNNYSMPLIRFDIGDMGVNGKEINTIREVRGRTNSTIKTHKGAFDSTALTTCFYNYDSIKRYQFIQKTKNNFLLRVEINNINDWSSDKNKLENKLIKILGKVNIEYKQENEIMPSDSGKYQYILSEVK